MENAAEKRPLDGDPRETDSDGRKQLKIDCDEVRLPNLEDIPIPKMKNPNKWKMLPSIVYELLGLFMSNGNTKDRSKEVLDDAKKELTVSSNQICEENCVVSKNENSKMEHNYSETNVEKSPLSSEILSSMKPNNLVELKPTNEDPILSLKELKPTNEDPILSLEESKCVDEIKYDNTVSTIEIKAVEIIDNNDQTVKQEINYANKVASVHENPSYENSSIPSTSLSNDVKEIPVTENIFGLTKRDQIIDLLKNLNLNGMTVVPTSKPPPCACKHCIYVDSLPTEHFAVNYCIPSNSTAFQSHYPVYQSFNSDMYFSSQVVSDCSVCISKGINTTNDCYCIKSNTNVLDTNTESSKQIWIAELRSMMRRNEDKCKIPELKKKNTSSSHVKTTMSRVKEVAKQIKTRITSCNVCKKYKYSICKCSHPYKKEDRYGDMRGKYSHRRYHNSHRY